MILLDTNVWVRSIRTDFPLVTKRVRDLLRDNLVCGHDQVLEELLLGKGGKMRSEIIEHYARLPRVKAVTHADLVRFIKVNKLANRGIGAVDAHLLAAAQFATVDTQLWTEDTSTKAAAVELEIAYELDEGL